MTQPKPNTMDDLKEQIKAIEFWQGTDGDPEYPEDIYDSLDDDVIDQILNIITAKMKEVDRAARLQENELLNIDELPMAIGNKVLERRVKLKASLKGGDV